MGFLCVIGVFALIEGAVDSPTAHALTLTLSQVRLQKNIPLMRRWYEWLRTSYSSSMHTKQEGKVTNFLSIESQNMRLLNELEVNLELSKDGPGNYTVLFCCGALVSANNSRFSPDIGTVEKDQVVNVLEIQEVPLENRIRARIEDPAGWMSLENIATGYRWIQRPQVFEDEVHVESELQRVASIMHGTSGRIRIHICPRRFDTKDSRQKNRLEYAFLRLHRRLIDLGVLANRIKRHNSARCSHQDRILITKSPDNSDL